MQHLVTALDAVTATTTSAAISVKEATKISLQVTRANHSAGSSAFSVEGTVDGTNYAPLALLDTAATQTRAASVTLGGNTTEVLSIDVQNLPLLAVKVTVTETTDGTHTAQLLIAN